MECIICKEFVDRKFVEVKTRVSGEWVPAHPSCAKECPGEHPLLAPRKIRTATKKKQICPTKASWDWKTKRIEEEVTIEPER